MIKQVQTRNNKIPFTTLYSSRSKRLNTYLSRSWNTPPAAVHSLPVYLDWQRVSETKQTANTAITADSLLPSLPVKQPTKGRRHQRNPTISFTNETKFCRMLPLQGWLGTVYCPTWLSTILLEWTHFSSPATHNTCLPEAPRATQYTCLPVPLSSKIWTTHRHSKQLVKLLCPTMDHIHRHNK